jgi:hypothetical protein
VKHGYPRLVLVTGGRDFEDSDLLCRTLDAEEPGCIVHGGARGADYHADVWAKLKGIPVFRCDANWAIHGKRAGTLRNEWMTTFMRPDLVVAFPTPKSRGTWHMVKIAERLDIPTLVVKP